MWSRTFSWMMPNSEAVGVVKQLIPASSIAASAALRRTPSARGELGASSAIRAGFTPNRWQTRTT
jgi:hypothetical protein